MAILAAPDAKAARSARLVYVRDLGAEACPDEVGVRTAVAARLGYDPFVREATTVLTARVRRENARFRTEVKLVENGIARGTRQMTTASPDCADAISAMALTISLAIDPRSLAGPLEPSPAPAAPTPLPPPAAPPEPAQPSPPPPSPTPPPPQPAPPDSARKPVLSAPKPTRFFAGSSVLGSVGMAANPAVGGTLFVGVRFWGPRFLNAGLRSMSVALEGRRDFMSSTALSAGGRARTSTYLVQLVPCVHPPGLRHVWYACSVMALGSLEMEDTSPMNQFDGSKLYMALGLRAGVGVLLAPFLEVRSYFDVLVPFDQPRVRGFSGDDYTLAPVSADFNLALALHF